MKIHSVLARGYDHKTFCQDALAIHETNNFVYAAIFDGCSGGKDSHFASNLFAKAFNQSLTYPEIFDSPFGELKEKAQLLVYMIGRKLSEVKQILHLSTNELLSTMILTIVKKETQECVIYAFGDGFFSVDGVDTIIKNKRFTDENMPNYIAYDLHIFNDYKKFTSWFSQQSESYQFPSVNNITIASDGIQTFKNYKDCNELIDPVNYLSKDEFLMGTVNMLERKCNIIHNKYCMVHLDDLSVIRIKLTDEN